MCLTSFGPIICSHRVAWLIGWALILEYSVGGAAVARGISPNLVNLLGGADHVPFILTRMHIPGTSIELDPVAAFAVVVVTILLSIGIKEVSSSIVDAPLLSLIVLGSVVRLPLSTWVSSGLLLAIVECNWLTVSQ